MANVDMIDVGIASALINVVRTFFRKRKTANMAKIPP